MGLSSILIFDKLAKKKLHKCFFVNFKVNNEATALCFKTTVCCLCF